MTLDQIDVVSGLKVTSRVALLRRERSEFVQGAEDCRVALFSPRDDNFLAPDLRVALAARMSRHLGDDALAASYDAILKSFPVSKQLTSVASGAALGDLDDEMLAAIIRHTDMVTQRPQGAARSDIQSLTDAGLNEPAIVALSELIAFVNYEARIIAGLRVLEGVI